MRFISALKKAFPIWVNQWQATKYLDSLKVTLDTMYEDITDEAHYQAPTNNSNISLYTNNSKGKGNKKKDSGSSSKTSKKYCNHRDHSGHLEKDCFKKYPEKKVAYDAK